MGGKLEKTKYNIAEKLDLPRDVVLNVPKITVIGDNEIQIENHKGIVVFQDNEIRFDSSLGIICVSGSNLEILFIGGSTVVIGGKFKGITYEGKKYE